MRVAWVWVFLAACTGARAPAVERRAEEGRPVAIGRSYTLASAALGEERRVNVYLPPGYAEGQARYPVLYLLDGGEAEDFHHISGLAQLASLNQAIRDMVVVGIEGTDRKRDFTHPSRDPRDKEALPTSGGSAAFRAFLARELKPWVEARYRTSGESVLMGESLAGLFVVETFLVEPVLFTGWVAVSPSLWWDGGALAQGAGARLERHPAGPRGLYLSIGNEGGGMREGVDALVAALKAHAPAGLAWHFEPLPDEHHNTIYHPAAFRALRVLLPGPWANGPPSDKN